MEMRLDSWKCEKQNLKNENFGEIDRSKWPKECENVWDRRDRDWKQNREDYEEVHNLIAREL